MVETKTEVKAKREMWYQTRIRELTEENARLRAPSGLDLVDPTTYDADDAKRFNAPNPLWSLPKTGIALVLNEWQRHNFISPWFGSQVLPNSRVEGPDRWSVRRNDEHIYLTFEQGYYLRDASTIDKSMAEADLSGAIRAIRQMEAPDSRVADDDPRLVQARLDHARFTEVIERCQAGIDAFNVTQWRFSLDLEWGEAL